MEIEVTPRDFREAILDSVSTDNINISSASLNQDLPVVSIRADLEWWLGSATFLMVGLVLSRISTCSDYFRLIFHGIWSLGRPSFDKCGRNINVCELWPVVAALHSWAPSYRKSQVHIITDNMQVLAMINTGRSANKTCMYWLRELFWICFVNNIDLFATYIKSEDNVLADALSRAAYPGVTQKCIDLLQKFNMCCSPPSRPDLHGSQVSSTDAAGCRLDSIHQSHQGNTD